MELGLIKYLLLGAAALLYFVIFNRINSRLKKGSRAERFKVGGSRLDIRGRMEEKQTREERQKTGKVSLRGGSLWRGKRR